MDDFDYIHISIGSCKHGKFKKGDMVEISPEGYGQGLHEYHDECFGEVIEFKNGLLSVIIYGEEKEKQYHPCFWTKSDKDSYLDWQDEKHELHSSYC